MKPRINTRATFAVARRCLQRTCLPWLLGLVALAPCAHGGIVYYGDDTLGRYSGTTDVLSLSDTSRPADGRESGGVRWNGSADVLSGEAISGITLTFSQLRAMGIDGDNFALRFALAEPGSNPTLNMNDFELNFYRGDGSLAFRLNYNAPVGGLVLGNSTGASNYDHLFRVGFDSAAQRAMFLDPANANWRVGVNIPLATPITGVSGGREAFAIAALEQIPEPSVVALWGIGAMGLGWRTYRKRRRTRLEEASGVT